MLSALGLACVLWLPESSCSNCGSSGVYVSPFNVGNWFQRTGPSYHERWAVHVRPQGWAPWFPSSTCCSLGTMAPGMDYYAFMMSQRGTAAVPAPATVSAPAQPPSQPAAPPTTEAPPPPQATPPTNGEAPR